LISRLFVLGILLCGSGCTGDDDGCAPTVNTYAQIAIGYAAAGKKLPAFNGQCGAAGAEPDALVGDAGAICVANGDGGCTPSARGDTEICAAAPDDDACTACLKGACCAEGIACLADTVCACFASKTSASCGVLDATYTAYTACGGANCAAPCPGFKP